MAEPERIVTGDQRSVGADELLSDERGQLGGELRRVGRERLDRAVMENLALHGPALEHGPLRLVELVETGREQRLQRRRHLDRMVARRVDDGGHLLHEERIAARGAQDPVAEVRA
jgi:hypothetical protein